MAVLPLMLHIVIYEKKLNPGLVIMASSNTFANWEDADRLAQHIAETNQCLAWVAAIERPSLIVAVK